MDLVIYHSYWYDAEGYGEIEYVDVDGPLCQGLGRWRVDGNFWFAFATEGVPSGDRECRSFVCVVQIQRRWRCLFVTRSIEELLETQGLTI